MNFYGVDKGTIFVDGQAIDSVQRDSLRKNFGMVLQDTWLFAGTVKENIAYGKEGATDEEIINAAKAASAHGFIKRLPNGYDTMITEDGGTENTKGIPKDDGRQNKLYYRSPSFNNS